MIAINNFILAFTEILSDFVNFTIETKYLTN